MKKYVDKLVWWMGERDIQFKTAIVLGSIVILSVAIELMFFPDISDSGRSNFHTFRDVLLIFELITVAMYYRYNILSLNSQKRYVKQKIDQYEELREKYEEQKRKRS